MNPHQFDRVLLIANPHSGGGKAARWLDRVAAALRQAGCAVDQVLTRRAGEGRDAARRYQHDNALVIAFGGDGTVNEVLNGADLERSTLAVIPAGTGNVLGKEIGMSRRPPAAVRQLLDGRVVRLDMGVCNGRRFICVFGAGVDAWVVRKVHERRGRGMTQWHYVPHVMRMLLRPPRWEIAVEVDGRPVACAADQVAVGNTHSYGGPLEMTPAAAPDDGLLDVMCVRRQNLANTINLTVCCFFRSVHLSRQVHYVRGKRVAVSAPGYRVPYQVDGEAAGFLPAEVVLEAGAVRLLVPAAFRPLTRSAR